MQSETGFPSSHQSKSYVAYNYRLKLAARAVLSGDAGLFVLSLMYLNIRTDWIILKTYDEQFTLTTKKSLHIIFKDFGTEPLIRDLLSMCAREH